MFPYIDRFVTDEIIPDKKTVNDRWSLTRDGKYIAIVKSDTGLIRIKNEDYYGVFPHPENKAIMLFAPPDGMGRYSYGDKASTFVVNEIGKYFKQSKIRDINDSQNYLNYLDEKIKEINNNLKYGGTTLTGAVVNEEDIITFNIGDSRTYGYKDKLTQLTEDDSQLWSLYKNGKIKKDDIRFMHGNNIMTDAIDGLRIPIHPKYNIVKSNSYDALLMTTDGIHDILSDEEMETIIENNKEFPRSIAYELVFNSLYYKEEISDEAMNRIENVLCEPFYETIPGKDNSTAVLVFTKNIKR